MYSDHFVPENEEVLQENWPVGSFRANLQRSHKSKKNYPVRWYAWGPIPGNVETVDVGFGMGHAVRLHRPTHPFKKVAHNSYLRQCQDFLNDGTGFWPH